MFSLPSPFCRQWASQHEGLSCEKFKEWLRLNSPEFQNSRLELLLSRNKIGPIRRNPDDVPVTLHHSDQLFYNVLTCLIYKHSVFSVVCVFVSCFADCPKCKFRFFLSKGGCLHFKCTQCQHEFCGGCSRPFRIGAVSLSRSPSCPDFISVPRCSTSPRHFLKAHLLWF